MRNINTHRSAKDILEEIRVASTDPNPNHVILPFSVLLVKLSEQENAATRKLVRLTWALFLLLLFLVLIVLPPLLLPWFEPTVQAITDAVWFCYTTIHDAAIDVYAGVSNLISQSLSDLRSDQ